MLDSVATQHSGIVERSSLSRQKIICGIIVVKTYFSDRLVELNLINYHSFLGEKRCLPLFRVVGQWIDSQAWQTASQE